MTSDQQESTNTALVKRGSAFSDDELAGMSWETMKAMLDQTGTAVADITDFGTGFTVLSEKDRLVGEPFIIVDWRFSLGTYGEMVTLLCVAKSGKWIINDGSTGIKDQMNAITAKVGENTKAAFTVPKGLTRSDYVYRDEKGNDVPATTYYLSMDKAQ